MSLLLIEGWDSLSALNRKYAIVGTPTLSSIIKRNGTRSLYAASAYHSITFSFSDVSTLYIGFALYPYTISSTTSFTSCFLRFYDSGTGQCGVGLDSSLKFVVYRHLSTLLDTSILGLSTSTWNYIEVKVTISDSISLGDFQIKVNGSTWLNLAATTDTKNTANNTINSLQIGGNSSAGNLYIDDLYILNTSGSKNNTFLGDVKVKTLYPNGNGNVSQFDGSDGNQVDNYLLVDEAQDDSDTTYIESDVVSELDQFTFEDLGETPDTIYGVGARLVAKKTNSGTRDGRASCRRLSTNYEGDTFNPSTDYEAHDYIWEDDPSTTSAWTGTGLNAAEFGIKVQA